MVLVSSCLGRLIKHIDFVDVVAKWLRRGHMVAGSLWPLWLSRDLDTCPNKNFLFSFKHLALFIQDSAIFVAVINFKSSTAEETTDAMMFDESNLAHKRCRYRLSFFFYLHSNNTEQGRILLDVRPDEPT